MTGQTIAHGLTDGKHCFTLYPMPSKYTETVTVTREVDPRIADLVRFARWIGVGEKSSDDARKPMSDAALIEAANEFWDNQHGED